MGWRMPTRSIEAVSSHCACVSRFFRGCVGSGRMRASSIRNAPVRRVRPASAPAFAIVSWSSGSEGAWVNARSAASVAAAADPLAAPLDLIEELSGDAGFFASLGMEGEGDAVGDTLLECCQVRDHRVKGKVAEM